MRKTLLQTMLLLGGLALAGSGCHPGGHPAGATHTPPSARMLEVDADTKMAPPILIPAIVEAALQGSPLGTHIISYSPVMFHNGAGVSCMLRTQHPIKALFDPANRKQVRAELLDILGHLVIPMTHHHIAAIVTQVMVVPPGDTGSGVAVEFDQLKLSDVSLVDLQLGDVVPPDRMDSHIKVLLDTWKRLDNYTPPAPSGHS